MHDSLEMLRSFMPHVEKYGILIINIDQLIKRRPAGFF